MNINIIEKIMELDKKLTHLNLSLLKTEKEKAEYEINYSQVLSGLEWYRQEIRKLKNEIEAIKAEIISQYILGNIDEPIIGARHVIRKVKDIEIVEKEIIPEKYKEINTALARKDALTGIEIPGIKIINKRIIAFR